MLCRVRQYTTLFLSAFEKLRKATVNSVMSVRSPHEQLGSHWPDFHEIWYLSIFRKSVEKVSMKPNKNNGYFTWRPMYIFITMRLIIRRMRKVSGKGCTESQNTHFTIRKPFFLFFFFNSAVYEIKWENIVQSERPQKTIWRMRISRWIPKATNTHSKYVILLFCFNSGCTNAPHVALYAQCVV